MAAVMIVVKDINTAGKVGRDYFDFRFSVKPKF